MVIQCNPFVANPPIFEIVGDPSPNPPISRRPCRSPTLRNGVTVTLGNEKADAAAKSSLSDFSEILYEEAKRHANKGYMTKTANF